MCDIDQRCIGFDICKLTGTLFRCRTCCEWRNIKGYTIVDKSRCKRIEKNFAFGTNLFLNSTATFNTGDSGNYKASHAVDGIKLCSHQLISLSQSSYQPWLLIQLESTYNIKNVVVYARKYDGFQVDDTVVSIRGNTVSHICGRGIYLGPTANDGAIIFMCPRNPAEEMSISRK